jgi:uncharacterized protein YndB with AHSA1/START domain
MTTTGTATVTLPTDTQILITREFNAPRHLVYRAWTVPEMVSRWWSAGLGEVTRVDIDLRVGGRWRWVLVADGVEAAFRGEYRVLVPDERIVYTEVFEGAPGAEALNTLTLADSDGRTSLALLVQFQNQQHRDTRVAFGEVGLQKALDLLERIAVSLA